MAKCSGKKTVSVIRDNKPYNYATYDLHMTDGGLTSRSCIRIRHRPFSHLKYRRQHH
ncbi:hypothetical protein ACP4OV_014662 [Aristida adscensionis]